MIMLRRSTQWARNILSGGIAMIQLSAEVLALSGEPALLARGGKILYANDAAGALLGRDVRDESLQKLLGPEVAGMQAPSFVGETELLGKRVLLRIRSMEGMRVVFLSPCVSARQLLGDAFFFALRNELMQLGVCVSLLQNRLRPENAGALNALCGISQSLYRVNRTLQNLMIIRGVEDGTLPFQPQALDLVALLRDLIDTVRVMLPAPEIGFKAPESLQILGDAALLQNLALNLLSNCILHAGGCTRIRVTLRCAGEHGILSVDDDGCGIPGDRLHTVLERYRFAGSLTDLQHGPGLGLTAAREVARLHGGTLLLESREGIGTAVRVSFGLMRGISTLQAPVPAYEQSGETILTGLASCLPPELFDPRTRENL